MNLYAKLYSTSKYRCDDDIKLEQVVGSLEWIVCFAKGGENVIGGRKSSSGDEILFP